MNIKSLAIAAAIVTTAGAAQAADLGHPVKAAVDYVKVCDAYGAGFFYIPGSDTCLQLSGYVRETIAVVNGNHLFRNDRRTDNRFISQTQAELHWDARSNTEFGLLRSYISIDFNANTGGGTSVSIDKAYIQLGGLTVGRAESMFDFYFGTSDQIFYSEVFPDITVNLLAYTFAFGNGVSATVSLEDSTTSSRTQASFFNVPSAARPWTSFVYGGNHAPDVVANINVTQAWGAAQVSGIAHEVYGSTAAQGSKWGYGVLAGVKVNLPMLGAGDTAGIQGTWGRGIMKAVSAEWFTFGDIGVDAIDDPHLTRAWAIGAGFDHHFSPTVDLAINGGVEVVNGFLTNDYTQWSIGSTLTWAPVKGFTVAGELEYTDVNFTSGTNAAYGIQDSSGWLAGVRFKRSF